MRNIFLFILLFLLQGPLQGQQLRKPVGGFAQDTAKLGQLLQYSLVHQHPATQEVILPDSNYNFTPFEFVAKTYFPTTTKAGISTDSAVYTLRTFETIPVQQLALPVYILQGADTIQVFATADAVQVQQLVSKVQEPLSIKDNTKLAVVEQRFNWPMMLVYIVAGLVFASLIWFVFGQAIIRKYKLYRLRKDHLYFASRYNSHLDRFVKSGSSQSMEKAVSLWKNYLTKLERSAINSFTTKEIVEYYNDDEIVNTALRTCDKAIYGNVAAEADTETKQALGMLRRFAKGRYKTQRELIRNAKTA
ncbi:hypothetical protein [Pontibacter cellulosilyticus]|uniref:Uncharacterized protein n=1 Tax=Pontibacter cellulosilyticus TaxID=1720253 RepID=A0A923N3D2_9BACT|nr:hypothetical protein [Pontibacter cellulosilyticus]MBC5991491.1 hypothetical protein [Pontibacter cellulosilyticus]